MQSSSEDDMLPSGIACFYSEKLRKLENLKSKIKLNEKKKKLRHVFFSRVYLLYFPHAVQLIPCQGSIAVTKPFHRDMPKTLEKKVFISLNNKATNFQIFVTLSPQANPHYLF